MGLAEPGFPIQYRMGIPDKIAMDGLINSAVIQETTRSMQETGGKQAYQKREDRPVHSFKESIMMLIIELIRLASI